MIKEISIWLVYVDFFMRGIHLTAIIPWSYQHHMSKKCANVNGQAIVKLRSKNSLAVTVLLSNYFFSRFNVFQIYIYLFENN